MNTVTFETEKKDGTFRAWTNLAMPVKYGQLLDEQLDYAVVSLLRVKRKIFKPLTRARLKIVSETSFGKKQRKTIDYFIANDEYKENPVGSGIYDHELSLIELTKFLECFPVESLCFTNSTIARDEISTTAAPELKNEGYYTTHAELVNYPNDLVTPSKVGKKYSIPTVDWDSSYDFDAQNSTVTITNKFGSSTRTFTVVGTIDGDEYFTIAQGENIVSYDIKLKVGTVSTSTTKLSFKIIGKSSILPTAPWTEEQVTKRILELVEPLRKDEKQRFVLNTEGKSVFQNLAPEYTFTRMNLRECLQMQGGSIHGEPRLRINDNNENEVCFDWYGGREYAKITNYKKHRRKLLSEYKYLTSTGSWDIEQACNRMESYMDNLVNRYDWDSATIGQPIEAAENTTVGGQTIRSEIYSRIEETEDTIFPTQYPIDRPVKLEVLANTETEGVRKFYDITKYLYEKTVYNNLSGYDGEYPSKDHALYYNHGEKNIKGLFYKRESAVQEWEDYAIKNIVKEVSGQEFPYGNYVPLTMRLTYVPIYSARVSHGKQYLSDYLPLPRTQNYTQGANSVESRSFGKNIKSTVQRMGNIDKYYTFIIQNVYNIPKAGQLWDEEYYISAVNVSVGHDFMHVTVGLSKHFNRKSQYIGVNSIKRIYEVSEKQVQQRHSLYQDYIVISDTKYEAPYTAAKTYLSDKGFDMAVNGIFDSSFSTPFEKSVAEISSATLVTSDKQGNLNHCVILPVISSAFGNCMEFTWEMEDNFSAGKTNSTYGTNDYLTFTTGVEYSNEYGRAYYLYFSLNGKEYNQDTNRYDPAKFPMANEGVLPNSKDYFGVEYNGKLQNSNPVVLRKDGREALKMSGLVEYVADSKDYIIGDELARACPLVHDTGRIPHLFVLNREIGVFEDKLRTDDIFDWADLGPSSVTSVDFVNKRLEGKTATKSGLSWCYAYLFLGEKGVEVEDEDGNVTTINKLTGGEILLAKNVNIKEGDTVGECYFSLVHDIYEYKKNRNL